MPPVKDIEVIIVLVDSVTVKIGKQLRCIHVSSRRNSLNQSGSRSSPRKCTSTKSRSCTGTSITKSRTWTGTSTKSRTWTGTSTKSRTWTGTSTKSRTWTGTSTSITSTKSSTKTGTTSSSTKNFPPSCLFLTRRRAWGFPL
ncbi:Os05g0479025 [Oryza sativa Japonica Group]|uniref:Os05g0479025 protein n=1 Tax=Oryza sativa subsp. japonica TaxID=39947 RepID=A0A0P0WNV1_ORYSJ|nr:Os05g0479025 [Oryza sativa Japonica Group]